MFHLSLDNLNYTPLSYQIFSVVQVIGLSTDFFSQINDLFIYFLLIITNLWMLNIFTYIIVRSYLLDDQN